MNIFISRIMGLLSVPLGVLMRFCYSVIPNYGVALVLTALVTKILTVPIAIKQQKNSIENVLNQRKLRPKLEKIKAKCGKNKELYNTEMMKLYQEEGINPLGSSGSGCLILFAQIAIMLGLIGVVCAPARYILKIAPETIEAGIKIAKDLQGAGAERYRELAFIAAVRQNPGAFSSLGKGVVDLVMSFSSKLFGMDLVLVPETGLNKMMVLPVLTVLTQILSVWQMNKYNMAFSEDPAQEKTMKIIQFVPIFAFAYLYFSMPSGMAFYFMFSGALSIIQTEVLQKFYGQAEAIRKFEFEEEEKKKRERAKRQELKESLKNGEELSEEEKKKAMSKGEYNRQKISEARKRIKEKYGE